MAKTGGRQPGTPNKITASVKDMILNALDAKGGQAYLEKQAEENPTAFMTLLGKILPKNIEADVNGFGLADALMALNQKNRRNSAP